MLNAEEEAVIRKTRNFYKALFRFKAEGMSPGWVLSSEFFETMDDVKRAFWDHEILWPVSQNEDGSVTILEKE